MTVTLSRFDVRAWDGVQGRLLREDPYIVETTAEYVEQGGYRDSSDLAGRLGELRGRGGAAFPIARKLAAVLEQPGPRIVVANGEEGEPASVKDRYLMLHRPHLVLDGLRLMTRVVAAERAVLYVSSETAERSLLRALEETEVLWDVPVSVFRVPPAYVAGEETALVRAIDGGPALPTAKPPRPFERGVGGLPTLVQNVETLAHVALLARDADAGDTFLATVSGAGLDPVLVEVPFGQPLGDLVPSGLQGAMVGGLFGGLLRSPWDLPLEYDAFRAAGSGLGCGSFVLIGPDDCPVDTAADGVTYLAAESARQCGVCINATAGMGQVLDGLRLGTTTPADLERMAGWTQRVPGRGACALVDAAARMAASLLREFPDEVATHVDSPCPRCADLGPLPRYTRNHLEMS
ncbi:MAG TPA: NADH-ubiquinone oxidoreductase-F iron-sulfur binding region domain-containing protein [Nocardioidaceae bacterium]|nr:NADH-ubiquinone oxidoreductase-F iron-sulfur binding region domain-containing protein [Nocardioidaceae bacterium]